VIEHRIRVTRNGQAVGKLPAERIPLDYPDMSWRADPAVGMDASGTIYAAIRMRVFTSADGGETWSSREVEVPERHVSADIKVYGTFGVSREGALLWTYSFEGDAYVLRSTNGGEGWEPWGKVEDKSPYALAYGGQGSMTELPDGTILWPVILSAPSGEDVEERHQEAWKTGRWQGSASWTLHVYRSTDGGRTWPDKAPVQPWAGETNILALQSGRLLVVTRYQRHAVAPPPPNEPPELAEVAARATDGDAKWAGKRVFFADSDDGGATWTNFRPLWRRTGGKMDLAHGEAHGHAVQLADGRVLVLHDCRYPYDLADVRARVSHDEGQSWRPEVYHVSQGHGYAGSVVLEDGTIVSVCGNTPLDAQAEPMAPWRAQVVRWRLPDEA